MSIPDQPFDPGPIPRWESGLIDWGLDETNPDPAETSELLVRLADDTDRILNLIHALPLPIDVPPELTDPPAPTLMTQPRARGHESRSHTPRSNDMNNVSIIGRLTADPEMHTYHQDGQDKSIARFRLAVDRAGRPGTDFVNVAAFGPTATAIGEHVAKGRRVAVEGRIRSTEWETASGERRYGTEIAASRVDFLERVKQAEETLDRLTHQDGRTVEAVVERDN